MSHFSPRDTAEHQRGNRGEEVADYCRECGRPFMEHSNSRCPTWTRREIVAAERHLSRSTDQ